MTDKDAKELSSQLRVRPIGPNDGVISREEQERRLRNLHACMQHMSPEEGECVVSLLADEVRHRIGKVETN